MRELGAMALVPAAGVAACGGAGTASSEAGTSSGNGGHSGSYAVDDQSNSVYSSGPDDTMGGPQTMTITGFKTTIDTTNGEVYAPHGTFDATCPWVNGTPATGTVTVHIDF